MVIHVIAQLLLICAQIPSHGLGAAEEFRLGLKMPRWKQRSQRPNSGAVASGRYLGGTGENDFLALVR